MGSQGPCLNSVARMRGGHRLPDHNDANGKQGLAAPYALGSRFVKKLKAELLMEGTAVAYGGDMGHETWGVPKRGRGM